MLSHAFIRSTACCRNSLLYRSPFLWSTVTSSPAQCAIQWCLTAGFSPTGSARPREELETQPQADGHDARNWQAYAAHKNARRALTRGTALRQALGPAEGGACHIGVNAIKRRVVGQVLRLCTELEIDSLRDLKHLAQIQVHLQETRTLEHVST